MRFLRQCIAILRLFRCEFRLNFNILNQDFLIENVVKYPWLNLNCLIFYFYIFVFLRTPQ